MAKIKSCKYYIEGMHCASCELLIEKKLLKQDNVEAVDASLANNSVRIEYSDGKKPQVDSLNEQFSDLGYEFTTKKIHSDSPPAISFSEEGKLLINPVKMQRALLVLFSFALVVVAFFAFERLSIGQYANVNESSSLPAFFVLGVVAGISSCAALIGGLLLSMVKQWHELYIDSDSVLERAQPHALFHGGRILGFALFGALLGLLGEAISLDNPIIFAILTLIVSVVMVVIALQMLGVGWAQQFQFRAPKFLTGFIADEENFSGKIMPFALGALTFFLPCGVTLLAQTLALASGSALTGSAIMTAFSLGTFFPLLAISISGLQFNSKPHLTARFNTIAGLVILFFAVYNINSQMNLLNLPSLSDINLSGGAVSAEEANFVEYNDEGVQQLNVIASDFNYYVNDGTDLRAGEPAKVSVLNQGASGCAVAMAATGLIDGVVVLEPGENTIEIPSPKKGSYKLTCSMGMVDPVTINVI
jgi:sulfite exporter TauE/SafE/copper chaperone CopZ